MSAIDRPLKSLLRSIEDIGIAINASQELSRAARDNSTRTKAQHPLSFL